jgi:hypothetical protein
MQRRRPGCKYPGSFLARGRFLLWSNVEVVSRPLRPQIILNIPDVRSIWGSSFDYE